ncbi:FAD-binding oxidoreductase [Papillibacter cinnamivorans]|uniref:Glycolate oxidase n=1 Tax=Papillibacter cinnamivorans DSM 12816 TaxID=1122930 RepID=A0A1W2C005_9FIRM|nr:FAD-binding oxidoreductase [Papillibacter cinnamivorans]SMC78480.1 glycolate oxidase [Papillibacter cinnamivorans DSM 12816]
MPQYNKVTPEILDRLKVLAPGRVYAGEDVNEDYAHDEMPIYGTHTPEAVVEVLTTEEVAEIMKLCNLSRIPVTPRGAGTGLAGGAVPIAGGIVLSTVRMKQILEYDLDNLYVRVQPGVLLNELVEDAAKQGLLYPPDPGEKFATLGGNVSTNAGGMRAVKYGTTRDYVRAMTAVLPTGEVLRLGAAVSKTSSGYSLLNLMIGSEGTLGVVTELTLKLVPLPLETVSLIVPYEGLDQCISAVPEFLRNHLQPQALEFMERKIVLLTEKHLGKSVFPGMVDGAEAKAYLLVTFEGDSAEELQGIVERASEVVLETGALDVFVADSPAKKKDAWAARSALLEAILEGVKLVDECDVVVPATKIALYLNYINSLESRVGLNIMSFGHAGDGNLHIYATSNDLDEDTFKSRAAVFMDLAYEKASEFGGLVSGEHGIGHGKLEYLEKSAGGTAMALMEGIKKVFDPNLILNPGKVCLRLK